METKKYRGLYGLDRAKKEALSISKKEQCSIHVNYNTRGNYYYLSDWYSDATLVSYDCGRQLPIY